MTTTLRLRLLREARGWSRQQCGHKAGVSGGDVGQMELQRLTPRPDSIVLARLARVLGIPRDQAHTLLDEVDDGDPAA